MSHSSALLVPPMLILVATPHLQAGQSTLTPEVKARIQRIAQASDKDPLATMGSEDGKWLMKWMDEVPDYQFGPDPGAFWAMGAAKGDLRKVMQFHHAVSTAAFQVEHQILDPRKKAEDAEAVALAGLEGLLRAYESLLPRRPENRSEKMDAALASRNKGELAAFLKALPPMPKR
jgi:hypothetical protein